MTAIAVIILYLAIGILTARTVYQHAEGSDDNRIVMAWVSILIWPGLLIIIGVLFILIVIGTVIVYIAKPFKKPFLATIRLINGIITK